MSSMETGSSATSTSGFRMIARAMTARCFCPPERSEGYFERNRSTGDSPTRSRASSTCLRSALPEAILWITSGWPTASSIVIEGFSAAWGSWKTIWRSVRSWRSSAPRISETRRSPRSAEW